MARGLADYNRSIRAFYGAARQTADAWDVDPVELKIISTLLGTGVIYGGYIYIYSVASQLLSKPYLLVDDRYIATESLQNLNGYNLDVEHSNPLYIRLFDEVTYKYTCCFSYDITFEKSVQILYRNSGADIATVSAYLKYALI